MDIELLKEIGEPTEHYVFIDSEDQRLYLQKKDYTYIVRDARGYPVFDASGSIVYGIDSAANRMNNTYDYVVTFEEPFENVVSVEILEAYIPTTPLVQDLSTSGSLLRYLTISCPEIEAYISRSKRRVDYTPSMARICWESLEKSYLRYTKPFKNRFFHPIGRVGKLHFQFFRNNTNDYINFAGAHHTMMLVVTTLKPKMKEFTDFILNPNYKPGDIPNHFVSAHAEDSDVEE